MVFQRARIQTTDTEAVIQSISTNRVTSTPYWVLPSQVNQTCYIMLKTTSQKLWYSLSKVRIHR